MIILDENIPEDQCHQLRRWRTRFRMQVGIRPPESKAIPLAPQFFHGGHEFTERNRRHGSGRGAKVIHKVICV
jgi:hypothetical protein